MFDQVRDPPALSIGAPSVSTTNTGPVTYTVTYTGASAVTLANGNVSLNSTGGASGTIGVSGTGTASRTVTITSITGNGTLGINIASGTASDAVGNLAVAAGPSTTFTVIPILGMPAAGAAGLAALSALLLTAYALRKRKH